MAPALLSFKTRGGGGVAYKDRARAPPPWAQNSQTKSSSLMPQLLARKTVFYLTSCAPKLPHFGQKQHHATLCLLMWRIQLYKSLALKETILEKLSNKCLTGGQLQSVRMRPTAQLSVKTCMGGGGGVGGRVGGGGGIGSSAGGGGPKGGGAARDPLLPHAYLKGVCVSGGMGV